jgi:hypothetical protein
MRSSEGQPEQQLAQIEAFTANTVATNLIPQSSQQAPQANQYMELEIKDYDNQKQGSDEENKATNAEELAYL